MDSVVLSVPTMTLMDPQMETTIPSLYAISSVQYCPYHPHLILCTALDGIMVQQHVVVDIHPSACDNLCSHRYGTYRTITFHAIYANILVRSTVASGTPVATATTSERVRAQR